MNLFDVAQEHILEAAERMYGGMYSKLEIVDIKPQQAIIVGINKQEQVYMLYIEPADIWKIPKSIFNYSYREILNAMRTKYPAYDLKLVNISKSDDNPAGWATAAVLKRGVLKTYVTLQAADIQKTYVPSQRIAFPSLN